MATDELTQIERKIDETTDASVEATRRIKDVAEETEQIAGKTVSDLDEQGEKLKKIDRTVDKTSDDIKKAKTEEYKLHTCGWCWYRCCMPCTRPANTTQGLSEKAVTSQPKPSKDHQGPYIKKVLNDDREKEIDNNLRETDIILDKLEDRADEIGDQLDQQNKLIPEITEKTRGTTEELKEVTKRVEGHL